MFNYRQKFFGYSRNVLISRLKKGTKFEGTVNNILLLGWHGNALVSNPCSFYTRMNMRSASILRKKEDTVDHPTTMKRKAEAEAW